MIDVNTNMFIEVSWEICNKVGGIYTVIKSKALKMIEHYKENYLLIGPYIPEKIPGVFEESKDNPYKDIEKELDNIGIKIHYGKWLIEGEPNVILIEFPKENINEIKAFLWDEYKIDSLRAKADYDEPVAWAFATGRVIEALNKNKKICCQCHEWLAGTALLYLKAAKEKIATVFTTHATTIGRTLAFNGYDIYNNINEINADEKAKKFELEAKHGVEKASAQKADVFTTVSEITAIEAEHLLGRKPDVLLPNGLDLDSYPTFEETSIEHRNHRDSFREFLLYYFFPYYRFDIKNTLFYFLASRYEFRPKGIDMYIRSLGELNKRLIKDKSEKTIIAFIFVPSENKGVRKEILDNRTNFKDIKDDMDEFIPEIKKNLLYTLTSGQEISKDTLFEKDYLLDLKRKVLKLSKKGTPPLSTHELMDKDDIIINSLKENNLNNGENDRVKVIFYPIYLTGADGLLDQNWQQSILASHLGVFPSYYEPWGYTPLECGALGVASITTDLAGFGRYIKDKRSINHPGVFILDSFNKKQDDIVKQLTSIMYNFSKLKKKDRVENKMAARKLASLAEWTDLVKYYFEAHNLAVKKIWN